MEKGRILVIEDHKTEGKILHDLLSSNGYLVEVASSGESGIIRAIAMQPDLILMDITLPGIDGFEAARKIQAKMMRKVPRILFLTASDSLKDMLTGFGLGGDDYIVKPVREDELLLRINRNIARIRQEEKERSKIRIETISQVMITIAHYINNSLAILQGRAYLTDEKNPEEVKRLKKNVMEQTDRIHMVVESIEEMAQHDQINTEDYVNMKDAMLSISTELARKMEKRNPGD